MKNKYSRYIAFCLLTVISSSCQKWLEVQPEDKFVQEQIYATPTGIEEVMTGFYVKLGSNSLYGSNLTLTTLDVFAQRYLTNVNEHAWKEYGALSYGETKVKNTLATIWTDMYATIANINDFVQILPTVNGVISEQKKNQYLGEAIGLRAFIHFDLLRMFGPIYDETTKSEEAIPYYTVVSKDIQPFESSESILDKILVDIETAENLLKANDPILTENGSDNFNNNRLNYYALLGLKARVYQWKGDKANALKTAKEVIEVQHKFPWVRHSAITANGSNPDRKFFSEMLFSVFNSDLYDLQLSTFDPNLLETELLSSGPNNYVELVYESNDADYRYTYSWPGASTGVGYRTMVKYQDIAATDSLSRFMVPVIRMSEMYYIAAESTTDTKEALDMLNTVRQHRSLAADITDYALLENELTKEYMKEFYGEGQLWYFYKRKKRTSIFTMNATSNQMSISLSKYRFDIPEKEMENR